MQRPLLLRIMADSPVLQVNRWTERSFGPPAIDMPDNEGGDSVKSESSLR